MLKKITTITLLAFGMTHLPASAKLPYYPIQFPRDEAAHFDNVPYYTKILLEWWYYNGKLTSKSGRQFGYYLSYIYGMVDIYGKKWLIPRIELQITDIDNKKVYGNTKFFPAEYTLMSPYKLDIQFGDSLSLKKDNETFVANGYLIAKNGAKLQYSFAWTPTKTPLLEGGNGLIDMTETTNSYYYSYTNLTTTGFIKIDDEVFEINPQQSLSWMDHQWGDFVLMPDYHWLWASVQLENGLELDLAVPVNGTIPAKQWVNIIMPDNTRLYDVAEFSYVAHDAPPGEKHPHVYDLEIPSIQLKLRLTALAPGQDVNGIWEGISVAEGTFRGKPIKGQANTENKKNAALSSELQKMFGNRSSLMLPKNLPSVVKQDGAR